MGSSSIDPYIGQSLVKGFTLRKNLGSGEIGVVYEATNDDNSRRIAVKVLHPDVAEAHGNDLLRWAKRASQIRHAKVASILGANRLPDGTIFIVTEFVSGDTLMGHLQRTGPLDPKRTADILFQLCSALAPIHRAGRPHANLKPENVFLVPTDTGKDFIKIVDVGSPTIFGAHHLSDEREVVGAAKYFSPEQATGQSVGLPSDQFTLGVIGYLLLTGALPFFGATPDQLLEAIVGGEPKPIRERAPQIPPLLSDIIHKCLAKDPYERFGDLRALATDLAKVIKSKASLIPTEPVERKVQESAAPTVMVNAIDLSVELDASVDESVDPDRTMVLSVPAQIKDFLDDDNQPAPTDIQEIPQPLSFTGELDSADIEAAVDESIDRPVTGPPGAPIGNQVNTIPDGGISSLNAAGSIEEQLADALADALQDQDGEPTEKSHDDGPLSTPPDEIPVEVNPPSPPKRSDLEVPHIEETPGFESPVSDSSHSTPNDASPAKHSVTGSLLPEDLISALGTDLEEDAPESRPAHESIAAAPVATVADFDRVSDMSERDKRSRLKSRGLGGVGRSGLSRPWMVLFLFVALVIAALAAKVSMQESELEEAKQQELQNKKRLARKAQQEKYNQMEMHFTIMSTPERAEIFEGEQSLGQTPLGLKVKRGGYRTLSLKMDGYAPVEKTVLGKQLREKRSKNILKIKLTKLKTVIDASAEKTTPGESGKSQATPSGVKGQSDAARQANKRAAAGGAGPKKRSAQNEFQKR